MYAFFCFFSCFILLIYCRLTNCTLPLYSEVYYCILNYVVIMKFKKKVLQDSNTSTNIQYDQYRNAKHVLKSSQTQHHHQITEELTSQGLIIASILKYASPTTSLWSNVQKNMPKNIFNFTLKYLSNSLATRKNLSKWCFTQSSACSFCLQSETLQHIVSSCKSYLEQGRYTWRHDSVLNFIASTLSGLHSSSLYADLPTFLFPSLGNHQ